MRYDQDPNDTPLNIQTQLPNRPDSSIIVIFQSVIPELDLSIKPSSLETFIKEVSECMHHFGDEVMRASIQRSIKSRNISNMMKELGDVGSSFVDLHSIVDETKLLAINTIISASNCGWSGESFANIVKQVNVLCNQSQQFLFEVKDSIESSHKVLKQVMQMINNTIDAELNVVMTLKGQVDQLMGTLLAHDTYMTAQLERMLVEATNASELALIHGYLQQDLRQLKILLLKVREHMLAAKQTSTADAEEDDSHLLYWAEKLELLASARFEIKKISSLPENPHFSLC